MLLYSIVRQLGIQPYKKVFLAMQNFTNNRTSYSIDEIWFVQHPKVFTQGRNEDDKYLLKHSDIPVVKTDRGGKITFHGPGQCVIYFLLDLRRKNLHARNLVTILEQIVISSLMHFSIYSYSRSDAPGVYVKGKKICSVGLRIRRGCSFHGLALNVSMDLSPFSYIHPCGYSDLHMTQVKDIITNISIEKMTPILLSESLKFLNLTTKKMEKWYPEDYNN